MVTMSQKSSVPQAAKSVSQALMSDRLAMDPADAHRIMRRLSLFRRQYFLNTNLVNQMLSSQVRQMRPFLVIR